MSVIESTPLYSILRIKRKRDGSSTPLDALVIDAPEPLNKRRRGSGAIASTVHQPTPNRGVFRYADTVPLSSFDNDSTTAQLRERIDAALLQNSLSASDTRKDGKSGQPVTLNRHLPERALSPQRGTVHNSPRGIEQVNDSGTVQGGTKRARFRVVEQKMGSTDNQSTSARLQLLREGPRPPEIQSASAKDTRQRSQISQLKIYEAIAEEDEEGSGRMKVLSSSKGDDDDDLISNFVPMLQDYFHFRDSVLPTSATKSYLPQDGHDASPTVMNIEDASDFVYDVYYRELREAVPNASGPAVDVSSLAGLQRIGELAGLEDEEILDDGLQSSAEEDEADQDSNEENDYRNDYPEGDSDASDDSQW